MSCRIFEAHCAWCITNRSSLESQPKDVPPLACHGLNSSHSFLIVPMLLALRIYTTLNQSFSLRWSCTSPWNDIRHCNHNAIPPASCNPLAYLSYPILQKYSTHPFPIQNQQAAPSQPRTSDLPILHSGQRPRTKNCSVLLNSQARYEIVFHPLDGRSRCLEMPL